MLVIYILDSLLMFFIVWLIFVYTVFKNYKSMLTISRKLTRYRRTRSSMDTKNCQYSKKYNNFGLHVDYECSLLLLRNFSLLTSFLLLCRSVNVVKQITRAFWAMGLLYAFFFLLRIKNACVYLFFFCSFIFIFVLFVNTWQLLYLWRKKHLMDCIFTSYCAWWISVLRHNSCILQHKESCLHKNRVFFLKKLKITNDLWLIMYRLWKKITLLFFFIIR